MYLKKLIPLSLLIASAKAVKPKYQNINIIIEIQKHFNI